MEHIIRKAFFDYEKEEKYLNEMSAKDLALTGYTWCRYVFQDVPKDEYTYRIELLEHPVNHQESENYIKFMEETGVEFVTSYYRWVYFRRRATDGEFHIYSDMDSRIKHYKRIRTLLLALAVMNLIIGIMNYFYGNVEISMGLHSINTYISILSFIVATLILIFLVLPLNKKISCLEKEKDVRE